MVGGLGPVEKRPIRVRVRVPINLRDRFRIWWFRVWGVWGVWREVRAISDTRIHIQGQHED